MDGDQLIELFIKLIAYFADDPMRVLALIGGSGGVVYWLDRYKNRTRLRVKLLDLGLNSHNGQNEARVHFEAENFGTLPMSLESRVYLKGIIPKVMRKTPGKKLALSAYSYEIRSLDRSLPSHVPKIFDAYSAPDNMRPFLWFMTYTFTPTRGNSRKIRIRSSDNFQLSYRRYICELVAYLVANKLNVD